MKILLLVGMAIFVFAAFFTIFRDENFSKTSSTAFSIVAVVAAFVLVYSLNQYQPQAEKAQEKGYTQVEKYIAEEGNTVTTHTESNIYTKDGKLYKAKTKKAQFALRKLRYQKMQN